MKLFLMENEIIFNGKWNYFIGFLFEIGISLELWVLSCSPYILDTR